MHKVDPFELEILRNCFDSIAENMALTIMRTAHSGIVRDSLDFSTAICDATGKTLAQGICTPLHMGSFYDAMVNLISKFEGNVEEGDVFIFNDPFEAMGQHLPDIYVTMPLFRDGCVVMWATALAHHSDVGGIVPGSNAIGASEVYQEGFRIPIIKLMSKGVYNQTFLQLLSINVRTPDMVLGDLQAQVASCENAIREFDTLCERFGTAKVLTYGDALQAYAERLSRADIGEFPDGVYEFEDHIDGLGPDPEPVVFKVRVEVSGEEIYVDWAGSSDMQPAGINTSFPFTKSCAYTAIRSIMRSDMPNCHGFTVPIHVTAEKGSLMNPPFPAATGARGISGYRMVDCVLGAMSQAVPDRVPADGSGGSSLPTICAYEDEKALVFCETLMGTTGACSTHDGQEGVPHVGANQSNIPIEMIEATYPIEVSRYEFIPNSGGNGKYRGGLGILREYRILADEALLNIRTDKRKYPPHGLYGGNAGSGSYGYIRSDGGNERIVPVLPMTPEKLKRGDVFSIEMPGGGGYGNSLERSLSLIEKDLREGKVTAEHAKNVYGVVCTEENAIDVDATKTLRAQMQNPH